MTFPDGAQTIYDLVAATDVLEEGEEFPPGWIVSQIKPPDARADPEPPINYEVWVEPRPPSDSGV